jgi:hypothetical protein
MRMIPILTTSTGLHRPETHTLKHGAIFLLNIILFTTNTELILEVLVVPVALGGFLRCDALAACTGIGSESARGSGRESGCTAVANEISAVEKFDQVVLSMARYGASVADASWSVDLGI